jgi:hypothetical protein
MNPEEAIDAIGNDTLNFLREHAFTPGVNQGINGETNFFMSMADMTQNIEGNVTERFRAYTSDMFGGIQFHAFALPVQDVGDLNNLVINFYQLPLDGVDLMITTQLSGCCIVIAPNEGAFNVAHLRPVNGVNGSDLQNSVQAEGRFCYGRNNYNDAFHAAMVGVRAEEGDWSFFTQTQDVHYNVTSADVFQTQ